MPRFGPKKKKRNFFLPTLTLLKVAILNSFLCIYSACVCVCVCVCVCARARARTRAHQGNLVEDIEQWQV